ncbi:unnamed protein product, partial [Heterosigma akashiwo]
MHTAGCNETELVSYCFTSPYSCLFWDGLALATNCNERRSNVPRGSGQRRAVQ